MGDDETSLNAQRVQRFDVGGCADNRGVRPFVGDFTGCPIDQMHRGIGIICQRDDPVGIGQLGATLGALGTREGEALTNRLGRLGNVNQALADIGFRQSDLSYIPMKMQMELLQMAQGTGDQAQTGQLTGQNYLSQLMLGGADANLKAQKTASELTGNLYNSLLSNLGGASSGDSSTSGLGGLGSLFGDLLKDIGKGIP